MPPPPLPREARSKKNWALIVGLSVLGIIVAIVFTGVAIGMKKAMDRQIAKRKANQKAAEEMKETVKDIQSDMRNSYDPEKGITNQDAAAKQLGRLQKQLQDASQNLSGEDARIMQVMSGYLKRLQTALGKYQTAMTDLTQNRVLEARTLTNRTQIEPRRQLVRTFLKANSELTDVIKNSEKSLRNDLQTAGVSDRQIESVITGFNTKAAPRNAINLQIRACDKRIGDGSLGILNLLESEWGKWRFNPSTKRILFNGDAAAQTYNKLLEYVNNASEEEIEAQGKLVRLQ